MVTEFVCTVGATGCDYTTPAAWETACDSNLTSAQTRVYSHGGITGTVADGATVNGSVHSYTAVVRHATANRIMVYHDTASETYETGEQIRVDVSNYVTVTSTVGSGAGDEVIPVMELDGEVSISSGTALLIDEWTTDATHPIRIRSKNAAKRSSSSALRFGAAAGRLISTDADDPCIAINESYVEFSDIDLKNSGGNDYLVTMASLPATNNHIKFERVLFESSNSCNYIMSCQDSDAIVTMDNCIVVSRGPVSPVYFAGNTLNLRFDTFYTTATNGRSVVTASGTINITNCYGNANGTGYVYGGSGGTRNVTTSGSSDATGTAGLQSLAPGDQFTSVTDGSEDFRLKAGADLIDAGTAIAGLTTDIYGTARPDGEEDLGVAELLAGGTAITGVCTITIPAITFAGTAEKTAEGAITGSCTITLAGNDFAASVLMPPNQIYVEGAENNTGVIATEPAISAYCSKLSPNIVDIRIQVSAVDDYSFVEDLSWDSGWLTLATPLAAAGRTEDRDYGEGA
jgi:hypothetical protein